jgi:hypothetical protein
MMSTPEQLNRRQPMSTERDVILKAREDLRTAEKNLREADNAAYQARMTYERAQRRFDDLKNRLGERRVRDILAGGQ